MKRFLLYPMLGLFSLSLPAGSQQSSEGQPFDHHNLPDGPDPFNTYLDPGPSGSTKVVGGCVEPEPPLLDEASLQVLGVPIYEEFERYASQAQKYLMCLDQIKFDYVEVMRMYGEEYRKLLQR